MSDRLLVRQLQRRVPFQYGVYFEGGHENARQIMKWVGGFGGNTFCEWYQDSESRAQGIDIRTSSGGHIFLQAKEWLVKEDVGFSICSNDRMRRDYVIF